jgi:tetratricopeptide (TPR) repeat protein
MRLHNIIFFLIVSAAFGCQQPTYAQQPQYKSTERPGPSTQLRELFAKALGCFPGVHTQEAIPFIEEWLRVYPTCSADDKYRFGALAIWMAIGYSDAMAAETEPLFVPGAILRHHPLTDLAKRVIRQALDAQTESWALNERYVRQLKDLLSETDLDDSLRKQATDLLNKPLIKTVAEFDRDQNELKGLANTITGQTLANEKVVAPEEEGKSAAIKRARKILMTLTATYPKLSELEKHQFAPSLLLSSTRLLRSTRLPQAESLFWIVEESVNPKWQDNGSISLGMGSQFFLQQKRYRSAIRVLQKSIALEASDSKRYNRAEDWMAFAEAYHALGRQKEAESAHRSALALYQQMHADLVGMGLDDTGPGSMKDQIERIHKLLKDE